MKSRSQFYLRSASLAASVVLCFGQAARATPYYWDTTTTGSWGTGANWSLDPTGSPAGTVVPSSTDSVVFNGSGVNGAEIITLDADRLIDGITFNNTGTTTFRANASGTTARKITLGTGGITVNTGAGNVTFSQTPATYGVLTIDTLATTQVWTNNATTLTTGPVIGSGQLTLTGANSSSVNNLGQFALDLSGYTGNLILNNSRLVNSVATNGFGTTGTITVNNGAQLGINVASTTISRAMTIAGNGWYDTGAVQRGAIRFLQTGTFSNTITLAADSLIVAGAAGEFTGKVTGGFNLQIGRTNGSETSTVTFSGGTANDYSGLTTISAGSLLLNKTAGVNAIAGNVLVTGNATVGGTLSNSANNQIADTSTVTVDSSTAVWTLNAKNETIDTLNLSGTYVANKGFVTGGASQLTVTNLNVSGGGVTLNSSGAGNQGTITATTVTNTGGTWVFGVSSGTQSLVIGSGGLTIGGGSTIAVAAVAGTADNFISLGGNVTSQANAAVNTISGAGQLRLNAARTLDVADGAAASDLTISAIVANGTGTGAITKTGAGLLTLSGANTYSGATTIENGALAVGAAAPSGSNGALGNATAAIALGNATSISSNLSPSLLTSGAFAVGRDITVGASNTSTSGVYTIGGNSANTSSFSGTVTLNQGLRVSQVASGTVNLTGNITSGASGTQTLDFNNAGTVSHSTGVIGGGTGIIAVKQSGAGTTTLSGANTYTGTTTIGAGILNAGVADGVGTGALGNGGAITFTGGTLQYSAASAGTDYSARFKNSSTAAIKLDNAQAVNLAGGIDSTNTQGLTKSGAGTLTLSGSNSYSGATAVTGGILAIANQDALNGTSGITVGTANSSTTSLRIDVPNATSTTVGSGKSVTIRGLGSGNLGALLGADSTSATWAGGVVLNDLTGARIGGGASGTLTVDGVISETNAGSSVMFSRAAGSTTILNKVNTYTGDTQFFMGGFTTTLKMGIANAINSASRIVISSITSGTGYFDLNGYNQNIRAISDNTGGDLVVTNSSTTVDAELKLSTTTSETFGGWIQDGASKKTSLVIAGSGSENFTNINTFTGGTRIDGGTLTLGHATDTLADTGAINVNGGILALGTNTDTVGAVTLTSGSITGSGAGTLIGSSYDVQSGTVSAKLGGAAVALTKSTAGTVTLSGPNTYTGTSTIRNGTVVVGVSDVASTSGAFGNAASDILLTDASSGASDNVSLLINGAFAMNRNITVQNNAASGVTTIGASSSSTSTFGGAITLNKDVTLGSSNASGKALFSNTISSPGTVTIRINNAATNSANGVEWTQTTANTYTGTVAVDAGVLRLAGPNSGINLITGNVTVGGGASAAILRNVQNNNIADSGSVTINSNGLWEMAASGTGNETVASLNLNAGANGAMANTSSSTMTLSATSVGTDVLTMTGGAINIGSSGGAVGVLRLNGNVSVLTSSTATTINTISTSASAVQLANTAIATRTFNVATGTGAALDQELQIGAVLADGGNAGSITKTGSGKMILSNVANTYSGKTTVQEGTLSFTTGDVSATANQSLGTNNTVDLGTGSSSGKLLYTGGVGTLAKNINALGNGSDTIENGGTGLLTLSGTLTKTGTTLNLKGGSNGITVSGQVTGTTVSFNSDLDVSSGTVTLTNASNNYFGPTKVYGGATLKSGALNALPTSTVLILGEATGNTLGTYDLAGFDQQIAGLTTAGTGAPLTITNSRASGTNTLTVNNDTATSNSNYTFSGVIQDGGSATTALTKTGDKVLTLSGANTYTGLTTINGGTLTLTSTGSLSDLTKVVVNSPGSFDISGISTSEKIASLSGASGSTLKLGGKTLEFGDADPTSFLGAIDSDTAGTLKKVGSGTFTLTASSYAGTGPNINISEGTLLTGAANLPSSSAFTLSGGTLATGTFTNTVGSLTVTANSVIDFAGGGTPVFTFASQGSWSGVLSVWNWSGSAWSSGTGGQLKFADGIDGMLLDGTKVKFYSGAGTGLISEGGGFIGNELVPVPEPSTLLSCAVLFGAVGMGSRRRAATRRNFYKTNV